HDDPLRLAALHSMTSLTGSALLALGVAEGAFAPEEAWAAAHVDEAYNETVWGTDDEAAARIVRRRGEFMAAVALLSALR
ncbi:MAG: ATPase, partial [Rhizobiaceae bacterium]